MAKALIIENGKRFNMLTVLKEWVKMDIQCRNKTDNVFIEHNGENLCLQDWANRLQITISTLNKRLKK